MILTSIAVGFGTDPIAPIMTALSLDYAATPWLRRSSENADDWHHEAPPDGRWWGTYVVRARSLAEARSLLPLFRGEGKAERFVLVIEGHYPHQAASIGTARHLASKALAATATVPGLGFAAVVSGDRWVTVHAAAVAALSAYSDGVGTPALGGIRAGIVEPSERRWLVGDSLASLMTPELLHPDDDDIYAVDVIVGQPPRSLPAAEGRVTPHVWVPGPDDLPPVDTSVISPQGFLPYADEAARDMTREQLCSVLTERDIASLRTVSYVAVDGARFTSLERPLARRLAQLSVAGVPLLAAHLPIGVQDALGQSLIELIAAFDVADAPVDRESKSIDLRRAALERFGPVQRWNAILQDLDLAPVPEPTVSVLLATRRPEKVASALAQVARQSWDRLEVILALHGFDAKNHPAAQQAIEDYSGELAVVPVPAETVFGNVLNAGTRVATGEYLAKMDDDDWYGPHHIRDLVRAAQHSGAQLIGAQVEFVYLESLDITTRRPPQGEQYADHVAGGTMLVRRDDLRQLGGWRPVHRAVDRCLLQAVLAAGGLVYRSHGQNYLMHRHARGDAHGGHTWNPDDSIFLQSVVEQWDGFRPPPQIGSVGRPTSARRLESMRSFFALSGHSAGNLPAASAPATYPTS